jgi:hypothetical protein
MTNPWRKSPGTLGEVRLHRNILDAVAKNPYPFRKLNLVIPLVGK